MPVCSAGLRAVRGIDIFATSYTRYRRETIRVCIEPSQIIFGLWLDTIDITIVVLLQVSCRKDSLKHGLLSPDA